MEDEEPLDEANELSLRACNAEMEGDMEAAAQLHYEAACTSPDDAAVQAAMSSHFVREQLPSIQADPDLAAMVAASFDAAFAAGIGPLCEYAVFLSKVIQDYPKALKAFQQAVEESPDDADLLYNYGNFLDQAMGQQDEAASQYDVALAANPDHSPTLNNFAALLVEQARTGKNVLGKAQELLMRAEQLAPGFPAYNLACIACQRGDHDECQHWLRVAYSSQLCETLPDRDDLLEDTDLAGVCEAGWFLQLLDEVARAQETGEPLVAPSEELI